MILDKYSIRFKTSIFITGISDVKYLFLITYAYDDNFNVSYFCPPQGENKLVHS